MKKAIGLILTIFISFAILILFFNFDSLFSSEEKKVIDSKSLYVGCWDYTDGAVNTIHISVFNENELVYFNKIDSYDVLQMIKLREKEYKGFSYFDLSQVMAEYIDSSIYMWHKKSPSSNYISISIEYSRYSYLSQPVIIGDAGIWTFNTPRLHNSVVDYTRNNTYVFHKQDWWVF